MKGLGYRILLLTGLLWLLLVIPAAFPVPRLLSPAGGTPAVGEKNRRDTQALSRKYQWDNSKGHRVFIEFRVSPEKLEEAWDNFGLSRGMTHIRYFRKQGFVMTRNILMVDYPEIYRRHLPLVREFARELYRTGEAITPDTLLAEFLLFVQNMKYQIPPMYMKGRKIMEFFPPLICLAQGYGDCDSKVVLLADLVSNVDEQHHKFAIVILNIYGNSHMLLAVRGEPMIGMTAINIAGEGIFLPVETSVPGYYPGFISEINRQWLQDDNVIIRLLN